MLVCLVIIMIVSFVKVRFDIGDSEANKKIKCNNACSPYGWESNYERAEELGVACVCEVKKID